ncbi:hypothetical protein TRFO_04349 [Tritrichomonas foetus]|uniref:Sel1 repeat family protein n=1 Tax=Tritrichomonas foetus TaxID=1144522 RepID=A0A1J4KGX8_9EUKA|nr:hypothetical protein TRFO_04349 [Tritrichomonas foetus]|eukprot:OHT10306.1 hypothetical protein TRFO_04349 [Tritrichomonas foetus]
MFRTSLYDKISEPSYSSHLMKHIKAAKDKKDIGAMIEYATALMYGCKGCKKDLKKSLSYIKILAEKGNIDGKFLLGMYYFEREEKSKAFKVFLDLAQNNQHIESMFMTARLYFYSSIHEIDLNEAIRYLEISGSQDNHKIKQMAFELAKYYSQNNTSLALHYFFITYNSLTESSIHEINKIFSNIGMQCRCEDHPHVIYKSYKKYYEEHGRSPLTDEILIWLKNKGHPPSKFDYATLNPCNESSKVLNKLIEDAAKQHWLPAIDEYISTSKSLDLKHKMKFCKYSIYFKSKKHFRTYAKCLAKNSPKEEAKKYQQFIELFYQFEDAKIRKKTHHFYEKYNNLLNNCRYEAMYNGNSQECEKYGICLQYGAAGLDSDPAEAFEQYKRAYELDKSNVNAYRQMLLLKEFGFYGAQQDFSSNVKFFEEITNESYDNDLTYQFCKAMDSGKFEVPYQYKIYLERLSLKEYKSQAAFKLAKLCYENKHMIPNYKYAEIYAEKAKKDIPQANAILAMLYVDPNATKKQNFKKAEKIFSDLGSELCQNDKFVKKLYEKFIDLSKNSYTSNENETSESIPSNKKNLPINLCTGEELFLKYNRVSGHKQFREIYRSAELGYPPAQALYGMWILDDRNKNLIKQDYKLALKYFTDSANSGIPISNVFLGYLYYKGLGTKVNYQKSYDCFARAIEIAEYAGYYGLALLYATGNCLPKDKIMAARYWKLAKETNLLNRPFKVNEELFKPQTCLSFIQFDENSKKSPKPLLTACLKEIRDEDYSESYDLYLKILDDKNTSKKKRALVERSIAFMKMKGMGTKQNLESAIELYESFGGDNPDDISNIDYCRIKLRNPLYLRYQTDEFNNLKSRAESYDVDAINELVKILTSNNMICERDFGLASIFLNMANDSVNADSIYLQAEMLRRSLNNHSDCHKEALLYWQSADLGNYKATIEIAKRFTKGYGIYISRWHAFSYALKFAHDPDYSDLFKEIREATLARTDVFDPDEEWLQPKDPIPYVEPYAYAAEIIPISFITFSLQPINQVFGLPDPQSMLEMGVRFMKGFGVIKSYQNAFNCLAQSALANHAIGKIYFAIAAALAKIHNYEEVFEYNILLAKLQGISLAYIIEAKFYLGRYNCKHINKEKAEILLDKVIAVKDPYAMYVKGRYLYDEEMLNESANMGFSKALYYQYKRDNDVNKLILAAEHGHPKAMYDLGLYYLNERNIEDGEHWLLQANNFGISYFSVQLGIEKLPDGKLPENAQEAFNLFRFAHELNDLNGTLHLGECYRTGVGCEKDLDKAIELLRIGADRKIPEFFMPCAKCYEEGKGLKNWYKTKKYSSKDKSYKTEDLETKVKAGKDLIFLDESDPNKMNLIYDPNKLFKIALTKKYLTKKCHEVGLNPYEGLENVDLPPTKIEDMNYFDLVELSSNLGLFKAQKELILQLNSGLYMPLDNSRALTLLVSLKNNDHPTAWKLWGDFGFYMNGINLTKENVFQCYETSSKLGSKSGKYKLGLCYIMGIGVDQNYNKGCELIDESGCKYAYHYLTTYTSYKPQHCKPNSNILSAISSIVSDNSKASSSDYDKAFESNTRFGIIAFHKFNYFNPSGSRKKVTPETLSSLIRVANEGSFEAKVLYGKIRYDKKEYEEAVLYLQPPADEDDFEACHYVGHAFLQLKNPLAKIYLTKSANSGNDYDMYTLGQICQGEEAIGWFEKAAQCNNDYKWSYAKILLLGILDNAEHNVPRNPGRADSLVRELPFSFFDDKYETMMITACEYYHGRNFKMDKSYARRMLEYASEMKNMKDVRAIKILITMLIKGEGGSKNDKKLWSLVKKVANSTELNYKKFSKVYAMKLDRENLDSDAIHYYERSGDYESIQRSKYLRDYTERFKLAQRNQREIETKVTCKNPDMNELIIPPETIHNIVLY